MFQLLELANPSQPLLRRLLVETPGTYHHSLMVGNLAERAAEAIGGDALLARVAAYYHDIGKLSNPVAFIENQAGGDNIHDELDPETSAQLLKSHVSRGHRHRLQVGAAQGDHRVHPAAPRDRDHVLLLRPGAGAGGGAVRRPGDGRGHEGGRCGRRPHGSATAARSPSRARPRSSCSPTRWRRRSGRWRRATRPRSGRWSRGSSRSGSRDDQFDECDLTLRDIELIREAFVEQLLGMYHQRVAYPQNKVVELESRRASGGDGYVAAPLPGPVADRRRVGGTASRGWCPGTVLARSVAAALEAAGAPGPATLGPDPHRRRRARVAQRGAHGQGRPDRRVVVPAAASRGLPAASGQGARHGAPPPAFSLPPGARRISGDVVVSVERAIDQAGAGRGGQTGDVRWDARDELRLLVTHGTLHVCGWDHAEPEEEAAMRALERELLGG